MDFFTSVNNPSSSTAAGDIITIEQLSEHTLLSKADWIVVMNNTSKKTGKANFASMIEMLKGEFYTKAEIATLIRSSVKFDGNRPITAGIPGLQGVVLGGTTIGEVEANLIGYLYPTLGPTASLSASNPVRLHGEAPDVRLSYSVNLGGNALDSITVNGVSIDVATPTGTQATATVQDVNTRFYMTVSDTEGMSAQAAADVAYYHNRYSFPASANLLALSDTAISAQLNAQAGSFITNNNRNVDYTVTLNNEYIYFSYPASLGVATFIAGGFPNTAYQLKVFQFENANGYITTYNLYRSGGTGTGKITVLLQ